MELCMDECGAEGAESGLMLGHAWVTTIGAGRGVGSDNRARRGKRCCGPPFDRTLIFPLSSSSTCVKSSPCTSVRPVSRSVMHAVSPLQVLSRVFSLRLGHRGALHARARTERTRLPLASPDGRLTSLRYSE